MAKLSKKYIISVKDTLKAKLIESLIFLILGVVFLLMEKFWTPFLYIGIAFIGYPLILLFVLMIYKFVIREKSKKKL